jgi:hypothetical protein
MTFGKTYQKSSIMNGIRGLDGRNCTISLSPRSSAGVNPSANFQLLYRFQGNWLQTEKWIHSHYKSYEDSSQ